jgi:hypothetical protein
MLEVIYLHGRGRLEDHQMSARLTAVAIAFAGLALCSTPVTAAEYSGTLSSVPLDVDVYDQPGGKGKPRVQFLKGGSKVYLQDENDHWCKVAGDAVPGGTGWIWCGMGDDGKDYSVKKVAAAPEPTEGGAPDPTGGLDPQPDAGGNGAGGNGGK